MQPDMMASFWEDQGREPNRWERLRDVSEKLRLVLDMPALCLGGADDVLEQLEQRLTEAEQLFSEPDWLSVDPATPEGLERYCANHVGALLEVLVRTVEMLAEKRAVEMTACPGPVTDAPGD
ncbi:MAG: hypothetical protein AAGU21_12400 [Solidesulfovibrio sp.]|jgi:hypothetical protein|uniref:hypothetical protein n=1 Tax=Solidesulfovibrio sp. TaxID=2910990 RepID=UPI002B207F70|nr:hypothetical protein [Solidesulfovibrio sp.]MEA4855065.1 hypothetical protein [Solidesulfovibrio sp.]